MPPKLLIIDKNRNLHDFLSCKISINKITKKLFLILEKTESKKVAISFKRNFIFSKNILCILNSKKDKNYYVLILPSEEICMKVFNAVSQKRMIDAHKRFRYRKFIEKFLRNACVQTKFTGSIYEIIVDEKNEIVLRKDRKRKFSNIDSKNSDENPVLPKKKSKKEYFEMEEIYEEPYFKIEVAERKGVKNRRLLIFPDINDKIQHFEFGWNKGIECFRCCSCGIRAEVLQSEENGKEFVKFKSWRKHVCSLRKYDPAKYTIDAATRIVESENFKVIKYMQKGISNSKLFIFDPTNKKLCRGYIWDKENRYYLCIGCNTKSQRIFAKIHQTDEGNEYLILSKNEHVCELREFNPEKYKDDIIVRKPLFEHVECTVAGIARKYLLIFTDENKKNYYKFSYEHGYLPICTKCVSLKQYIQAYILNDSDGNEYISIRNKKHHCKPVEYDPNDFIQNQIIKPPGYQLIKRYWRGRFIEKLVIFDPVNANRSYELTKQPCKTMTKYICNECHHKYGICVTAWIINFQKENEYIELNKTQHKCSPIKFEDPNLSIVNSPNFKVIKSTKKGPSGKSKDHLLIYSSPSLITDNKKLCYRYYFDQHSKAFTCHECEGRKRKIISAKIFKNENGEDFVQLGENSHICEPLPEKIVLQKISSFYNILK